MKADISELFDLSGVIVAIVRLCGTGTDDLSWGLAITQDTLQLTALRERWHKVGPAADSGPSGEPHRRARRARPAIKPEDIGQTYLVVFAGDAVEQFSRDRPVDVTLQAGG